MLFDRTFVVFFGAFCLSSHWKGSGNHGARPHDGPPLQRAGLFRWREVLGDARAPANLRVGPAASAQVNF